MDFEEKKDAIIESIKRVKKSIESHHSEIDFLTANLNALNGQRLLIEEIIQFNKIEEPDSE